MARHLAVSLNTAQGWFLLAATGEDQRAAGVKAAARRWIGGAGHVAFQHHQFRVGIDIGQRNGSQQRLGIGVQRLGED